MKKYGKDREAGGGGGARETGVGDPAENITCGCNFYRSNGTHIVLLVVVFIYVQYMMSSVGSWMERQHTHAWL